MHHSALLDPLTHDELRSSDCGQSRHERARLTHDLLQAAFETADEDERAELRARVVLINRGVAESVARRYQRRGISQDDLDQVAYEGLTKAVSRFDVRLRHDLLTFAVPTIRGELQRHFRDRGWTVRPPRRIQEVQSRSNAVVDRLEHELGRDPTEVETAESLGVSVEDYREAMAAQGCFQPTSLDLPVGSGDHAVGDLVPQDDGSLEATDARVMLAPVVRRLSARDRRILYLRFFEDQTQAEIGEELGVTQMQVSRLLTHILSDLRRELEGAGAAAEPQTPATGGMATT